MKNVLIAVVIAGMVFSLIGCETMGEKSKTGAVTGGLLGATAGGIIGHQTGHGWQGALIGGATGAVAGGLIGNEMDKNAAKTNPNHLSLVRIAEMGSQGVPSDVIIDEIRMTNSQYQLTTETMNYLRENGVGDRVIDYMLSTSK